MSKDIHLRRVFRSISQPPPLASSFISPGTVCFSVAELSSWKRMVGEARRIQAKTRHLALTDHGNLVRLVSPVKGDGKYEYPEYRQLDEMYWSEIGGGSGYGEKTLFLSNYENRRAEYYYKKAVEAKPADVEALSGYTNLLWVEKKDLVAAEKSYWRSLPPILETTAAWCNVRSLPVEHRQCWHVFLSITGRVKLGKGNTIG